MSVFSQRLLHFPYTYFYCSFKIRYLIYVAISLVTHSEPSNLDEFSLINHESSSTHCVITFPITKFNKVYSHESFCGLVFPTVFFKLKILCYSNVVVCFKTFFKIYSLYLYYSMPLSEVVHTYAFGKFLLLALLSHLHISVFFTGMSLFISIIMPSPLLLCSFPYITSMGSVLVILLVVSIYH